ncbi:hypothetical protein SDC9_178308 [bioreactor metagenome]|uniref:Uncharacterized protein n=1 Tax=bioreactor metagenome TaxID=1076179 RepID=A0A645GVZ4_9ZZZZ
MRGQIGEGRDGRLHLGAGGDVGVARHGADDDVVALALDAGKVCDGAQVGQGLGAGQPQLHRCEQRLPTSEQLGAGCGKFRSIGQRSGALVVERVHGVVSSLRPWLLEWRPTRAMAMQACRNPSPPSGAARPARH